MNPIPITEWRVVQIDRACAKADEVLCITVDGPWANEIADMLNSKLADDSRGFVAYPPGKTLWEPPKRDRIAEDFSRALKIIEG